MYIYIYVFEEIYTKKVSFTKILSDKLLAVVNIGYYYQNPWNKIDWY